MHPSASSSNKKAVALVATAAVCGLLAWVLSNFSEGDSTILLDSPRAPHGDTIAAAATAPVSLVRQDVERRTGYYTAPVGTVLTYGLRGQCEFGVDHPEAGKESSGFQVRSAFAVAIADRRGDEILTEVTLKDLSLSPLAGGETPAVGAQEPFHVRLAADGAVLGYRFAPGLSGEDRNFLRGLFSAYAHRVPADAQGTWESKDADPAGELIARFTLRAGDDGAVTVERRKLRYEAMGGDQVHPHDLAGQSQAALDRTLGWIAGVDTDERMTLKIGELGVSFVLRSTLHFALQAQAMQAPPAVAALWDEPWLAAAGHREITGSGTQQFEHDRWSQRLAGESLTSLTQALAALLAATTQDAGAIDAAWQAIIWLVKLHPEVASEIRQAVGAGMEERLRDMLVSALGASGTDAAQEVLAAMRRDPSLAPSLRTSATMSLFQLAQPNARVLGDIVADISSAQALTGDDAMAVLLLGALAPRATEVRIGGKTPLEALLAVENRARHEDRLDLWLGALGNVGTDAVVPHAQRLLSHDLDGVRSAAFRALRRVQTPQAIALLERGLTDPSPQVRTDVVAALSQHRSKAASAALIRTARDDADPEVRRASQRGLARVAKSDAPARQALAELAQSDPDPITRSAARDLLRGLH